MNKNKGVLASHFIHGLAKTRLDDIYYHMIQRCHREYSNSFKDYGAKGITVCEEWRKDKTSFFQWALNNGYSDELTLDRIDNSKGYCPENCRWASWKIQQNNRTNNHWLEIAGERHTVSEWSDISHIPVDTIYARLKLNWEPEDAVFTITQSTRKKLITDLVADEILNYLSTEPLAEWRKVMEYATQSGYSVKSFRRALNMLIDEGKIERQWVNKGYHKGTNVYISLKERR